MHLSKLEIFGFKSFANRTVIDFTRGITGIVGPNGCGKTNIVDAIRWVLGEQKSATLRSDKMESVIFNGTREKKPMGMSEVSLTLVNDRGVLPTEYSEITITRRIFRSGESEYLLNKNICRLKDITNLFMDTGMGTNAYSVIELKMIEVILSSKAEERRKMFEEAAGVNKYKLRRRLSLKKLDDVKADLTRVNDIVAEVEKTVRSLERQAKRADQYNQILSVLKEKEINLVEHEFALYNRNKTELMARADGYKTRKDEIDQDIRKVENELIVYRNRINSVETELQNKRAELSENTNLLHSLQKNISVSEERANSLRKNHERLIREIEELGAELRNTETSIEENRETVVTLSENLEDKIFEISQNEIERDRKREELETKRASLKELNDSYLQIVKEVSEKENQINGIKKDLDRTNSSIEKLNQKILNITNNIAKTVGFIEELTQEKSSTEKQLEETESQLVKNQKEKDRLEKELSKLKESEVEEKTVIAGLKEKINFLQSLISNLEGISKGAKTLLQNEGWTSKDKNLFADVGSADEKYRFAMEASLKSVLNNLLIDNIDDLKNAVDYLNKNELGKATFFLLQSFGNGKKNLLEKVSDYVLRKKIKKMEREPGFINWASQLVETETKWKPYFEKVLFKTAIVETLDAALELNHKYPDFSFATLNGDFVHSSGVIEGGSLPQLDETLFGRKQILENLKNEFPKYEESLGKLRAKIADTEEKIASIDLRSLTEKGRILSNDITNLEKQISQFEFEKKKSDEEIDGARREIQELAQRSNNLDNRISELQSELSGLEKEKDSREDKINNFEDELRAFEDDFNQLITLQNQKKVELERLKGQIENTNNSIARSEQNKTSVINGIEKRKQDLEKNENESEDIISRIEEDKVELEKVNAVRSDLVAQEEEVEKQLKEIKGEASGLETQLNSSRNQRQEISDEVHSIDIKVNEINLRLENIAEHIKENYSVELELKEFEDLDTFNYTEESDEVHKLKDRLKNLGPVNLLAYSEYEQERDRLDFLHKQRDDLIESEKDLIKTINEINETAQNLFTETFAAIRENFIKIFQTLFNPGDEADLLLEENVDPLEAKIEIIAKPKGKRPTSIELLSGGEKTLTATALLFAIYLVKPSPFCILDEVDAPLDDANVDRFTRLLKEFSDNTQFIIVTHNKRTMEAAETMYGVTMQDEGISKLVGVRFDETPSAN